MAYMAGEYRDFDGNGNVRENLRNIAVDRDGNQYVTTRDGKPLLVEQVEGKAVKRDGREQATHAVAIGGNDGDRFQVLKVNSDGELVSNVESSASSPVYVQTTDGTTANAIAAPEFVSADMGLADLAPTGDNMIATSSSSAQYTLPTNGGRYLLVAAGASVYVAAGTNPTATVGGKGIYVPEGLPVGPFRIAAAKLAAITAGGSGYLYTVELD